MDRRAFLKSVAPIAAAPGFAPRRAAGAEPADKLFLGAPLTHSDWMLKPNIAEGAEGVRHMLDACKAAGWSRVYWRAFDAGQATYKSQLLAPGTRPEEDNFYNPKAAEDLALQRRIFPGLTPERSAEILAKVKRVDYAGFDSLAAAVEYGHAIGLQIHAWATINEDDHGWGSRSEFAKAHPEWRWVRRDGRPYRSQLSFAFEEVRRYKLALIEELLAGYAIDGLLLDWIRTGDVRDNPQNDPAGIANYGHETPNLARFKALHGRDPRDLPADDDRWASVRAEPQTLFMRRVRELARSRPRPVAVAALVGHPWHYRGDVGQPIAGNLKGLLLDTGTWAEEGLVDSVVAAGYYRDGGTPEQAHCALREETRGKVDVWTYAWVPRSVAEFERDFALARSLGAPQILFWEADYIDDRPDAGAIGEAMTRKSAGMGDRGQK